MKRSLITSFLVCAVTLMIGCDSHPVATPELIADPISADGAPVDQVALTAEESRILSEVLPFAGKTGRTISRAPVYRFDDPGGQALGTSLLIRDNNTIYALLRSTLTPGHAITLQWVLFNAPENCSDGACGEDDLTNPDARVDILFADGKVIRPAATASSWRDLYFFASRQVGHTDGSIVPALFGTPALGLEDARKTEVHLTLRTHGAVIAEMEHDMISTFAGGCDGFPEALGQPGPNTCADIQFAIHAAAPLREEVDVSIITNLTVDADGNTVIPVAADPATPLYYRRTGLAVLAPDGHHVTAGEFAAAEGRAVATCLQSGTQIKLHLSGLMPNATYRIWLLTFKAPGFDLTLPNPFVNLIGNGALGPKDRSRNTFKASASGQGQITRIHPAGLMSETLPVPPFANEPAGDCLLTDHFEWHAVGAFQQPGQPDGPEIGPPVRFPETAVEQFVFVFKQ